MVENKKKERGETKKKSSVLITGLWELDALTAPIRISDWYIERKCPRVTSQHHNNNNKSPEKKRKKNGRMPCEM
jgi:hypothetical protein